MKYHENHQKRALGVIVADSSKNCLFLRGLAPTPKNMVLSHLDPMWLPWAPNPGGMWVLVCVCGGCVLDQPAAARKPGGGGLITLILFTVAKDNRANARLKATKLKKLRDPPSSELPYQRNKETRHEYLQDSGPDLLSHATSLNAWRALRSEKQGDETRVFAGQRLDKDAHLPNREAS